MQFIIQPSCVPLGSFELPRKFKDRARPGAGELLVHRQPMAMLRSARHDSEWYLKSAELGPRHQAARPASGPACKNLQGCDGLNSPLQARASKCGGREADRDTGTGCDAAARRVPLSGLRGSNRSQHGGDRVPPDGSRYGVWIPGKANIRNFWLYHIHLLFMLYCTSEFDDANQNLSSPNTCLRTGMKR